MLYKKRILHHLALALGLFAGLTATGIGAKANSVQQPNANNLNLDIRINQNAQNYNAQNNQDNGDENQNANISIEQPHNQAPANTSADSASGIKSARNSVTSRSVLNAKDINADNYRDYQNYLHTQGITRAYAPYKQMTKPQTGVNDAQRNNFYRRYRARNYNNIYSTSVYHAYRRHRANSYKPSGIYAAHHHTRHVHNTISPIQLGQHHKHSWFRDGLSHANYKARSWISWHESGHNWNILSYGHLCVGYFQLNPGYLGYKHGHINLNPKHQVKVADRYVRNRYGNWVNAKAFWEQHHWY